MTETMGSAVNGQQQDSARHSAPANLAPALADAEIARDYLAHGAPIAELDLGPENCRWPLGDPRSADFEFCRRRKLGGGPYCPDHAALAVQRPGCT